jgi:DNA-binding beta-propeller fold protein YncE
LRKLERKYSRELAVIGVHSPKFTTEQQTDSLRQAILRLNVGHPVVNDRDFQVWRRYAVRAWPTLMFIDPQGKVIGKHEGEFPFEALDEAIRTIVQEFGARGLIDRRPLAFGLERLDARAPLQFPGKVLADEASGRLVVSDTGHNRIVVADLDGRVRQVAGSGRAGLEDGPAASASFNQPQGLALDGELLYVADAENHALRAIDLGRGTVTTLAGTGEQLMGPRLGGPARHTSLSSPWDLVILNGVLYVAMAGTHQLWAMPLGRDQIGPLAGNGREALEDGPLASASMNQPSGLTTDGTLLYVADSEASAIRVVDPGPGGSIRTIVGEGLFEFGDRDGVGPANVRLQHPQGVAWHAGRLYVADTYNHKVKRLDPRTAECRTFLAGGEPGHRDGPSGEARFSEPCGIFAAAGRLYVADTNNHAIRVADLATGTVSTVELRDLDPPPTRD